MSYWKGDIYNSFISIETDSQWVRKHIINDSRTGMKWKKLSIKACLKPIYFFLLECAESWLAVPGTFSMKIQMGFAKEAEPFLWALVLSLSVDVFPPHTHSYAEVQLSACLSLQLCFRAGSRGIFKNGWNVSGTRMNEGWGQSSVVSACQAWVCPWVWSPVSQAHAHTTMQIIQKD